MKNNHFLDWNIDIDTLEEKDENVLMTQIRYWAHVMENQLHFSKTRTVEFTERKLEKLKLRLKLFGKKYNTARSDYQWAKQIAVIYENTLVSGQCNDYPNFEKEKSKIEESDFEGLMKNRRSIREFNQKPISDALLGKIVQYGSWAPNNCNTQALRYLIVKNPEIKNKIKAGGFDGRMGHCILVIISDLRFYPDTDVDCPYHDSGAAIQNILLGCHFHGLGACYVSDLGANAKPKRKLLDIAEYEKITAFIWLGNYDRVPLMPKRKIKENLYQFV